jgi:hypothetical protein
MDVDYCYRATCPSCGELNVAIYGPADARDGAVRPRPRIISPNVTYRKYPLVPVEGMEGDSPRPVAFLEKLDRRGWKCLPCWYGQTSPITKISPSTNTVGWLPNTQDACQSLGDSVWTDRWGRSRVLAIEAVLLAVVVGQGLNKQGWSRASMSERRDVALTVRLAGLLSLPARLVNWNIGYKPGPHPGVGFHGGPIPRPTLSTVNAAAKHHRVGCYQISTEAKGLIDDYRLAILKSTLPSFHIRLIGALCGCTQLHDWYDVCLTATQLQDDDTEEMISSPMGYLRETILISRLTFTQAPSWSATVAPSSFVPSSPHEIPLFRYVPFSTADNRRRSTLKKEVVVLPVGSTEEVDLSVSESATKRILTAFASEDSQAVSFLSPIELKYDSEASRTPDGIWANQMGNLLVLRPSCLKKLSAECATPEELLGFNTRSGQVQTFSQSNTRRLSFTEIYADLLNQLCFGQQEMRTKREFELVRSVRALGGDPGSPTSTTEPRPSETFSPPELVELSIVDRWIYCVEYRGERKAFSDLDRKLFARAYLTLASFTSARVQQTPNWEKFARFARMGAFDLDYYRRFEFAATQCSGEYCP